MLRFLKRELIGGLGLILGLAQLAGSDFRFTPLVIALLSFGALWTAVVAWYTFWPSRGRTVVTTQPAPTAAPQPARLAQPALAPEAIRGLETARDALAAGRLHADSAELENALQRAHIALYGPGLRVAGSPIYLPQLRSPDLIVQRIDEVLERLRGAT